jgi:hypothetical protein
VRDLGKFCKYHCQHSHDIDFCDEFHHEVEKMMTIQILRVEDIKIDSEIRMIVSQEFKNGVYWSLEEGASY